MTRLKDELGKVFNRLTVIGRFNSIKGKARWLCRCSCGNKLIVTGDSLRQGRVGSCGCFRKDHSKLAKLTHGMSGTSTYRSWQEMWIRCTEPSAISFQNYGGRGIKVDSRWEQFENFFADMGIRPKGTSLDRIDNDADYSPENCKWSSKTEQARNKRNNVLVKYRGREQALAAWCEELNLPYSRTYNRIVIQRLDAASAFEKPFVKQKDRKLRGVCDRP